MKNLEIEENSTLPKEVLETARYAYEKVPLYSELAAKKGIQRVEFFDLPFVGKDVYMESEVPYLSLDYIGMGIEGKLIAGKTSGSTGKITNFYWSREDEKKSLLELWYYRKKYYNISPRDKMCYFFPIIIEEKETIQNEHILGLSKSFLYNGRLLEAYYKIVEYQPKWMILQPSVVMMLGQLIKTNHLPVVDSVEYIEFTGEYLEQNIRSIAQEIFGCHTANQYGIREVNSIAYECPYGHMHVMSKNAYVEIIGEEEVGDICITSLKNRAMPYVRYMTGDKGRIVEVDCPCGNHHPVLEVCNGRANDWIRKSDKSLLHPFALLQVMSQVNLMTGENIIQYQLVQKAYDYFLYRLVVKEGTDCRQIEQELCQLTARRLNQEFSLQFQYFDQIIPDVKTGKIAAFLCEME